MQKLFGGFKMLAKLLLFPTIGMSLALNFGKEINQPVMAYEPHEFVFIQKLTGFAGMTQENADKACKDNFRDIREPGIFNQKVEDNVWHIWAHLDNQHCVMNIRKQPSSRDYSQWTPSNNSGKRFEIIIPRFD